MMRRAMVMGAVLLGIGSAAAADLPGAMRDDGLPFVPLFAWAGTHVGLNAGYGTGGGAGPLCLGPSAAACLPAPAGRRARDGIVGGGQVGYTLQVGRLVGGIEADIQGLDVGSAVRAPGVAATERLDVLGTVRARFGIAADRFLVYATGGFAVGDTRQTLAIGAGEPRISPAGAGTQRGSGEGWREAVKQASVR